MTHEEFADKIRKALGGRIPIEARQNFGEFIKYKKTEIWLNYDWIRHNGFYRWIMECPEIDFGEGSQGLSVWICHFGTPLNEIRKNDERIRRRYGSTIRKNEDVSHDSRHD